MSAPAYDQLPPGTLDAIYEAAITITSELSLPIVLNRIVALACDLVDAQYGALGVPDVMGEVLAQFITHGISQEDERKIGLHPTGKGVLGMLLEPGAQPLRLKDVTTHPRSVGYPKHHPKMKSFLGVPIRSRGKLLGNLYLTDKMGAEDFTELDQRIIETLAGYAAVAIENARLYQQVQRLAVLEERERIGMDLHDGIIQSIYAVGLSLEHLGYLMEEDLPTARERLRETLDGLNTIIKDIRNYILDLRPERFQGTNLSVALDRLAREFQANTLAIVNLNYDKTITGRLNEQIAVAAFHIIQEALANAAKHAAASRLDITVSLQDSQISIDITDDGRGFTQEDTEQRLGHGLSNMQLRARSVGGSLVVESVSGVGTTVQALLPLNGAISPAGGYTSE